MKDPSCIGNWKLVYSKPFFSADLNSTKLGLVRFFQTTLCNPFNTLSMSRFESCECLETFPYYIQGLTVYGMNDGTV